MRSFISGRIKCIWLGEMVCEKKALFAERHFTDWTERINSAVRVEEHQAAFRLTHHTRGTEEVKHTHTLAHSCMASVP